MPEIRISPPSGTGGGTRGAGAAIGFKAALRTLAALILLGISGAPGWAQQPLPPTGEAWVIFGTDTVEVELARTPEEREQGLMYRESLPDGRGMLFLFPDAQYRSFWMHNTYIPLDIAYMDENLRIVDIQAMDPQTDDGHPSAQPAMFALEVPQGWFESRGIPVGAQAQLVFGPGG